MIGVAPVSGYVWVENIIHPALGEGASGKRSHQYLCRVRGELAKSDEQPPHPHLPSTMHVRPVDNLCSISLM